MKNDEIDFAEGFEYDFDPIPFPRDKDLNGVIDDLHRRYPDAIFHIGTVSSFIFVGDYETYRVDMPELSIFKEFELRPVKEVTKMLLADNKIRVIIHGDENGSYWFKSEYDKARPGFKWVKNKEE